MKTLVLKAKDFKEVNGYKEYQGKEDLTNFEGNLEFEADLGWIKFLRLKVSGYILIKAGGSIKAGDWIEAGGWIEAVNGGITLGLNLVCTGLLKFKLRLFAGTSPYNWNEICSKEVKCGKLEGNVVYGDVVETGLPESESAEASDDKTEESFTIDGKKYIVTDELRQALKNITETNYART